jgi:hypothetical protein
VLAKDARIPPKPGSSRATCCWPQRTRHAEGALAAYRKAVEIEARAIGIAHARDRSTEPDPAG